MRAYNIRVLVQCCKLKACPDADKASTSGAIQGSPEGVKSDSPFCSASLVKVLSNVLLLQGWAYSLKFKSLQQ